MLTSFFERFTDVLIEKGISEEADREIIAYGFSAGIMLLINILTTIIIGALFGMFLEGIMLLISFSLIRTYAGGYHHESPVVCYFMSSGIIAFSLGVVKYLPQEYVTNVIIAMLIVSIPVIWKLAPLSTDERPLDDDEIKHFRKKAMTHLSVECVILVVLLIVSIKNYALLISLGIFLSAILLIADKILVGIRNIK